MLRMVLLRHELPNAPAHFDWLILPPDMPESGDPDQRCLLSFASSAMIAAQDMRFFVALPRPLHRRHYLTFQGDIGGGRGRVRQVAQGSVDWLEQDSDGHVRVGGRFLGRPRAVWYGLLVADRWHFQRLG